MKVVTSGLRYLDIDAYGGTVAYAELLNLLGEEAIAASSAPFNESITSTILGWEVSLVRDYQTGSDDVFIIVDLSDPGIFDKFVDKDRVVEIIDHHMEFVDYWQRHPKTKTQIEFIGAACTLVFERWQQADKLNQISETSARLLIAGILDNTLNFRAQVTTERDRTAYIELMKYANLPDNWPSQYFAECQQETLNDLRCSIKHDVKIVEFPSLAGEVGVGQLVVWNAKEIADTQASVIREAMANIADKWFMNIVSIEEGKNYLVASDENMQQFLEQLLDVTFSDDIGATDRLGLRKEIMKADLDRNI